MDTRPFLYIVIGACVVFVMVLVVGFLVMRQLRKRHRLLMAKRDPPDPLMVNGYPHQLYIDSTGNTNSLSSYNMPQNIHGLQLYEPIGSGSFGQVYRGKWKGFLVAVKVQRHVSDGSTEKIRREAELSLKMKHPNVV